MQITVQLPEDIARHLGASHPDLSRAALEGIALEGARSGELTTARVRRLLGFETPHRSGCLPEGSRGIFTSNGRGHRARRRDQPQLSPPMVVVADTSPLNS